MPSAVAFSPTSTKVSVLLTTVVEPATIYPLNLGAVKIPFSGSTKNYGSPPVEGAAVVLNLPSASIKKAIAFGVEFGTGDTTVW